MSFLERQVVSELHRAYSAGELELDELVARLRELFTGEVMPTTPPDGGT